MKKTLAILALGLTAIAGHAATPLWMRDVQISPDGTEIAFCYKGDIYKVPAKGGTATQLTTQESYECTPIWSPDGKQIAFASDRYGNFDVFVMPADGGTAQCWLPALRPSLTSARRRSSCSAAQARPEQKRIS